MTHLVENRDLSDLLGKVVTLGGADGAAVNSVFGQPITEGGVTVIPVARLTRGIGGGAGTGRDADEQGEGGGGGLAVGMKPAGVYVIRDGAVSWRPAVDVGKVILGAQIVGVVALLTIRAIAKAWLRRSEA